MIKQSYQEIPAPEDLVQHTDEMIKGKLPAEKPTATGEYKDWGLIAKESLTNLKGEIDSILTFKLPRKTRAEELKMIHQRLSQKRRHAQLSDQKFARQKDEGASAYLEEKIKEIEKERGQ